MLQKFMVRNRTAGEITLTCSVPHPVHAGRRKVETKVLPPQSGDVDLLLVWSASDIKKHSNVRILCEGGFLASKSVEG